LYSLARPRAHLAQARAQQVKKAAAAAAAAAAASTNPTSSCATVAAGSQFAPILDSILGKFYTTKPFQVKPLENVNSAYDHKQARRECMRAWRIAHGQGGPRGHRGGAKHASVAARQWRLVVGWQELITLPDSHSTSSF
jgi:hypothetical protein